MTAKSAILAYAIDCDVRWNTQSARVSGSVGDTHIEVVVECRDHEWRLNGVTRPELDDCVDLDLNFSPLTNLLPIRRSPLEIHHSIDDRAAWLRFPTFELEPLEQTYTRVATSVYRYSSAGGAFVADLEVAANGLVTTYPGFFEIVRP